jgi:hypothetical protein
MINQEAATKFHGERVILGALAEVVTRLWSPSVGC